MDHGIDLGPGLVDRAVDVALKIARPRIADRRAVELELDNILAGDEFGAQRARQQIVIRLARVANADVAVGIDHVLLCQNPVRDHQIANRAFQFIHAAPPSPPASQALLRATVAEGFWRVSSGCERNRRAGIRGQRLPRSFKGAPGLTWDYWKKLFFVVCTPTLVNSSAMLGLISFATSKSALLAATSPFISLATPRPYSAAGEFGVSLRASS